MRKGVIVLLLAIFMFSISAHARITKDQMVCHKAVLTLNDGTVMNGYLRTDIQFMRSYVLFSRTEVGEKSKYRNDTIKSLFVRDCLGKGVDATFVPIKLYKKGKKKGTTAVLAIPDYRGKHVRGYMCPTFFDATRTSAASQEMRNAYTGVWWGVYNVDADSTRNRIYWDYASQRKQPKSLKACLKELDKNFKGYPQVREAVERQGITVEQIDRDPTVLLEILDKSL